MPIRALIVQSDPEAAAMLLGLFAERGDSAAAPASVEEARAALERDQPDVVLLDLQLPHEGWMNLARQARRRRPDVRIILTTSHPDLQEEMVAKEENLDVFLRQPFTSLWLNNALLRAERQMGSNIQARLPRVRIPVRVKITLPYALLALLLAMGAGYIVSRVVLENVEERFTNQLIETRKLASDWMVQQENQQLEMLRLLANLEGMPEALLARDSERLRTWALPVAVNAAEEAIEFLDLQGTSILSLRLRPSGNAEDYVATRDETVFAGWDFVRNTLQLKVDSQGDKYAGVEAAPWGNYFYIAGPVYDNQGQMAGVILVGRSLRTLAREIRQATLAHVSLYWTDGQPIVSTLLNSPPVLPPDQTAGILASQDTQSLARDLRIASIDYSELLGPWEVRGGSDVGLVGTALPQTFLVRTSQVTQLQILALVTLAFLLIILIGVYLAERITQPLMAIIRASARVADGDLTTRIDPRGSDELAYLGHSFNFMVSQLGEGAIYRDLLGRTASPEVRDQLRHHLASGDLQLEGQNVLATVLMSDIRGFTTIAEQAPPDTLMRWLNEYFDLLTPVITDHGGMVNQYVGDSIVAFFGVLPRPLPSQASALQACEAALEMLHVVEKLNVRRQARGDPPFVTGIGINTGPVTAGSVGTKDRISYTVVGDTVNTAQRLEEMTRQFGESAIICSQQAREALGDYSQVVHMEWLGILPVRGKVEEVVAYRLLPDGLPPAPAPDTP